MRTIDECTAEVFRRSNIKIKNRKRKSRIFLCCVPVVFCICSLAIWKAIPGESTDGGVLGLEGTPEVGSTSTSLHYFDIKSADEKFYITDDEAVSLILNILETPQLPENITGPTEEISPPAQTHTYGTGNDKLSAATNYLLTYYAKDGKTRSYTLNGSVLIDNINGKMRILDDSELSQLLKVLGIA